MKNHDLNNLIKKQKVYILSPHFDDAILSTGMFLSLFKKIENVTIINCFTRAHNGPYTISGRQFLKTSGYKNAEKLYKDRSVEDKKALSSLKVKFKNLDMADALFRLKEKQNLPGKILAELNHLYPTYKWHIAKKINKKDKAERDLMQFLKQNIEEDAIVFAPMGIGNHVDHVIVCKAAKKIFKNPIFYVDFPYNVRLNYCGAPPRNYSQISQPVDMKVKSKLAGFYATQINGLFKNGKLPPHEEIFYVPNRLSI